MSIMENRFDVIGCKISKTSFDEALHDTLARVSSKKGGYVCFTNVHACVMARNNPRYRKVLNDSFLTLPDGRPVFWVGKMKGIRGIQQIPGPDFLPKLLAHNVTPPLRHYFYGGRAEVLEELVESLKTRFPHAVIVGWESPPYRELTAEEDSRVIRRIRESRADVVWVGLGAPKQEYWMESHCEQFRPAILLGVGAAFDFHAGNMKRAPAWARAIGLEWLHRLMQEPRRLWKRYLVTNTLFIFYVFKSLLWK